MSLYGSTMPGEVGLRLLLSPLSSNVVFRTACCSVGVVLPVYSTFKAIETKNPSEQQRWLVYWAAYGTFIIAETFTDKLISWFPFYYQMKFAFLVWLQLPTVDGANQLYVNHLRPFLLRHQARLDQIVGVMYREMAKFFSAHQAEMQFARTMITKVFSSAKQAFSDTSPSTNGSIEGPIGPSSFSDTSQSQPDNVIEGPTSQVEEYPESNHVNEECN